MVIEERIFADRRFVRGLHALRREVRNCDTDEKNLERASVGRSRAGARTPRRRATTTGWVSPRRARETGFGAPLR